jgi:hypothetical protein
MCFSRYPVYGRLILFINSTASATVGKWPVNSHYKSAQAPVVDWIITDTRTTARESCSRRVMMDEMYDACVYMVVVNGEHDSSKELFSKGISMCATRQQIKIATDNGRPHAYSPGLYHCSYTVLYRNSRIRPFRRCCNMYAHLLYSTI